MRTRATPGARVYSFFDQRREVYKKLVVDAEGKKLLGAMLVGDASDYCAAGQIVLNAMALPENPESMLFPAAAATAGAPPTNGVGRAAGSRADLLLQQRHPRAASAPPSKAAARRSAR